MNHQRDLYILYEKDTSYMVTPIADVIDVWLQTPNLLLTPVARLR